MRLAKVSDYRRHLRTKADKWELQLRSFRYQGVTSLGDGEIPLSSPIVLLAGPNGVGKTTLLRALWAAAAPGLVNVGPAVSLKLTTGTVVLSYHRNGTESSSTVTFAAGKPVGGATVAGNALNCDVLHFDAAEEVRSQQLEFCSYKSIEDIINGVGERPIPENTLREINFIAGRDYREIKIFEIETGRGTIPFFEVALGDDRYDSRTMGSGELAILFLWWSIDRAPKGCLIMIEEPETYLSPKSQENLTDFLIASVVEKNINLVMSSHSRAIISRIPAELHVYLFRQNAGVKVISGLPTPALLETMGLQPTINVIAVVEDGMGSLFARQILELLQPALSRRIEIVPKNGDGEITVALRAFASQAKSIRVLGIYDGDVAAKIPDDVAEFSVALPCGVAIEIAFKDLIVANPRVLSSALGRDDIEQILFGLQGKDHHDWFVGLADQLGQTQEQLFPTIFRLWVREPEHLAAAKAMIEKIEKMLISPPRKK